jgi:hypothetical protein
MLQLPTPSTISGYTNQLVNIPRSFTLKVVGLSSDPMIKPTLLNMYTDIGNPAGQSISLSIQDSLT